MYQTRLLYPKLTLNQLTDLTKLMLSLASLFLVDKTLVLPVNSDCNLTPFLSLFSMKCLSLGLILSSLLNMFLVVSSNFLGPGFLVFELRGFCLVSEILALLLDVLCLSLLLRSSMDLLVWLDLKDCRFSADARARCSVLRLRIQLFMFIRFLQSFSFVLVKYWSKYSWLEGNRFLIKG